MLALIGLAGVLAKKKPRPSPALDPSGSVFSGDGGPDFGSGPSFGFGAPFSLFFVGLLVVGVIAYLGYRAKQRRIHVNHRRVGPAGGAFLRDHALEPRSRAFDEVHLEWPGRRCDGFVHPSPPGKDMHRP